MDIRSFFPIRVAMESKTKKTADMKAYHRAYYEAHKEKKRAQRRAYYAANKEAVSKYNKTYYQLRKEDAFKMDEHKSS